MREPKFWSVCFVSIAIACGGAGQEPKTPSGESETGEAQAAASSAEDEEASEKPGGDAKKESEGGASASSEATPTRSAKDVLLKPEVLYVFSFAASEPHQKAEEQCKKTSKDDPQKTADCMTAASKRFDQDAMAFETDEEGKYWWLTVQRKGTNLITLHRIAFDIEKESPTEVTLKPRGPDKGKKPLGAIPKELVVEVEGESKIAIKDPKLGRLVYEAKLGLMGKPGS